MPDSKTSIVAEYLHLPIFQEDLKARGEAMTTLVNALSKALADQAIDVKMYQEELKKLGFKFTTP
jgi:hypothetical protein